MFFGANTDDFVKHCIPADSSGNVTGQRQQRSAPCSGTLGLDCSPLLCGGCLPTTGFPVFPGWGFILQFLFFLFWFCPIMFKSCLVTHFRYQHGNISYPLVLRLPQGFGNNEAGENREKKPETGKYSQEGKQGKSSWEKQDQKYK